MFTLVGSGLISSTDLKPKQREKALNITAVVDLVSAIALMTLALLATKGVLPTTSIPFYVLGGGQFVSLFIAGTTLNPRSR